MSKLTVEDTSLVSVADAIRTKGGTTDQLVFPDGFVSAIEGIQVGEEVIEIATNWMSLGLIYHGKSGTSGYNKFKYSINNLNLAGNMKMCASQGYIPYNTEYGSYYTGSKSVSYNDLLENIFENKLPDGKYTLFISFGSDLYKTMAVIFSVSNGEAGGSFTVNSISSTKTSKEAFLFVYGIYREY